jgi:NAD(P)-dependent dehydrogenase (short-subunit alcohol dehydrogenase family)
VLVNNAGVYSVNQGRRDDVGQTFGDMDYAAWERVLRVNAMAPFKLAEAFVEHVASSDQKKIAIVSSGMGSIAAAPGGFYAYRSSKAALNMVAASLARDLAPRGIRVALLSPGWVRTRMGGPSASLSPEESVRGMRARIAELDDESTGHFLSWDGSELPW